MTRFLETDWGLLVLRLGLASLLIGLHGWTRLIRAYDFVAHGQPWTFVSVVERLGFPLPAVFAVLSAMSESIAVLFLAFGLFTRTVAVVVAFNMAVAFYNEAAKGDPFELPALYLLGAAVLAITGPGRASLDWWRRGTAGAVAGSLPARSVES
jgi:putative oxidoreductase